MKKIDKIHLFSAEKVTLSYVLVTSIILLFMQMKSYPVAHLFYARVIITLAICCLAGLSAVFDKRILRYVRYIFLGVLLSYWYTETFEFNKYLANCDYLLAGWDQVIFHCQPSLLFAKVFPQNWISELMNLGYFFYYFIIVGPCILFYWKNRDYFEKYFFKILFSFFVFYTIFILFPTSGPQYYFAAIGQQKIQLGIFPQIGDYFRHYSGSLQEGTNSGFFKMLVECTQQVGERPTAAFPSSHVGIATLVMLVLFREKESIVAFLLFPLYLVMVFATVYIQAHFVIDVIFGFVLAFVLDAVSSKAFDIFPFRRKLDLSFVARTLPEQED